MTVTYCVTENSWSCLFYVYLLMNTLHSYRGFEEKCSQNEYVLKDKGKEETGKKSAAA